LAVDETENLVSYSNPSGVPGINVFHNSRELVTGTMGGCPWRPVGVEPGPSPIELARRDATGVDSNEDVSWSEYG
jgi:hypothetical protein